MRIAHGGAHKTLYIRYMYMRKVRMSQLIVERHCQSAAGMLTLSMKSCQPTDMSLRIAYPSLRAQGFGATFVVRGLRGACPALRAQGIAPDAL